MAGTVVGDRAQHAARQASSKHHAGGSCRTRPSNPTPRPALTSCPPLPAAPPWVLQDRAPGRGPPRSAPSTRRQRGRPPRQRPGWRRPPPAGSPVRPAWQPQTACAAWWVPGRRLHAPPAPMCSAAGEGECEASVGSDGWGRGLIAPSLLSPLTERSPRPAADASALLAGRSARQLLSAMAQSRAPGRRQARGERRRAAGSGGGSSGRCRGSARRLYLSPLLAFSTTECRGRH